MHIDTNSKSNYLNHMHSRLEPRRQLIQNLCHQLLMFQNLTHFHDPNYGCLNQQFAVLLDILVGGFFLHSKLGFHRYVDVHAQLFARNGTERLKWFHLGFKVIKLLVITQVQGEDGTVLKVGLIIFSCQ